MKRIYILIGVVALLLVLAAGAFTAVRLLASQNRGEGEPGIQVFEDVYDDGSGPVTVRTIIDPAPELPQEEPATAGILTRVEDNSLFVGTGNTSVNVQIVNGEPSVATDFSGPEIEVVVGRDTLIYQDVTNPDIDQSQGGEYRFQQEVRQVDSLTDLKEGSNITVWGRRSGDRVVADVLVFNPQS